MAAVANTRFGQLVIGPPGSGKTTYVAAMAELLTSLGRKVAIVNLDPGNENMSYTAAVDVAELVAHPVPRVHPVPRLAHPVPACPQQDV